MYVFEDVSCTTLAELMQLKAASIIAELKAPARRIIEHRPNSKAGRLIAMPDTYLGQLAQQLYDLERRGFPLPEKIKFVAKRLRYRHEACGVSFVQYMNKSLEGAGSDAIAIHEFLTDQGRFMPISNDRAISVAPLNASTEGR